MRKLRKINSFSIIGASLKDLFREILGSHFSTPKSLHACPYEIAREARGHLEAAVTQDALRPHRGRARLCYLFGRYLGVHS